MKKTLRIGIADYEAMKERTLRIARDEERGLTGVQGGRGAGLKS